MNTIKTLQAIQYMKQIKTVKSATASMKKPTDIALMMLLRGLPEQPKPIKK